MSRKRVLVPTVLFGDEAIRLLEEADDVELVYALAEGDRRRGYDGDPDFDQPAQAKRVAEALRAQLPDAHALHAIGAVQQLPVTREMLELGSKLEVVFVPSAGTDAIDVAAATELGIAVVNAAGNNYRSASEHTVGLMLSLVRMIAVSDRLAHRNKRMSKVYEIGLGYPAILHGGTVGIVGLGFIGRETARLCQAAFGMQILATDPYFHPVEAERLGVTLVEDLDELLSASDFVVLHPPLTDETRGLIGAPELATMKSSAFLINAARGPVVKTDALVEALHDGIIAGAALDVTDPEPLPRRHPLFDLDNVILTPHIAGAAPDLVPRAQLASVQDMLATLRGDRPRNLVNPEVWPAFMERHARAVTA